jgi:glycerol-3-phosphate dehydrogenase (NAD(P)+)
MKIAVLGAGAWGTAISISLAPRHAVTLWARNPSQAREINEARVNRRYLPEFRIPANVTVTSDLKTAHDGCDLQLIATTTSGLRAVLKQLVAHSDAAPLLWLCKGFEIDSAQLPHEVSAAELGTGVLCGALSGPSFAHEVAQGMPTALTLASADSSFARRIAGELHHDRLRIYSSDDIVGVEIAGALKNVMAIAAGICDGLGLGHNARAALITRGLAEITRIGLKLGGRLETFMGLAGVGDLVLTCTGDLSRNRSIGLKLAQGIALDDALSELGHVAEGVSTARAVDPLARRLAIDMPITRAVCRVLDEKVSARAAVEELLRRNPTREHLL